MAIVDEVSQQMKEAIASPAASVPALDYGRFEPSREIP
jgi:hypothetical protein